MHVPAGAVHILRFIGLISFPVSAMPASAAGGSSHKRKDQEGGHSFEGAAVLGGRAL